MFNFKIGRKLVDLEAKLSGVNGHTGHGEIEFEMWKDGMRELEIELRGVAGRFAEIFANGDLVAAVEFDNGRLDHRFISKNGDELPELGEGALIEVRQNGQPILEGVLRPD